jgi:hypothetical protein
MRFEVLWRSAREVAAVEDKSRVNLPTLTGRQTLLVCDAFTG